MGKSLSPQQHHNTIDSRQGARYNLNTSKDLSSARDHLYNHLDRGIHGTTLDDINDEV